MISFLSNKVKKGVSTHLALSIVSIFIIVFLWTAAVAEENKPADKAQKIVSNKQKAEPQTVDKLQIGTYKPQQVFNLYYHTRKLRGKIQQLQIERKMNQEQLQQMVKQKQPLLIQQFKDDFTKVIPKVAKDADVLVVATQVVYCKPSVEFKDLTATLANEINKLAKQQSKEQKEPAFKQPLLPGQEEK